MPDTVVGLFRTRSEAELALRKLKDAGFGPDQATVSAPGRARPGHYGLKVLIGVLIGVGLGAIVGFVVSGMAPGTQPLVHGSKLATFVLAAVTGAATGGVAGALFSMAAAGGGTLYYEQEVEAGRFLVSVVGARLELVRETLAEAGALEAAPVEAPLEPGRRPRPQSG